MGDSLINSVNETLQNEVQKKSPEGMMVAYTSLTIMALLPILYGSYRSVSHHKQQKESGEATDTMTRKDVAMFPLIASAALLGLYIVFKIFSQEYINLLLAGYFFFLGIFSLSHILSPFIKFIDSYLPQVTYHFKFGKTTNDSYSELAAFVLYYSSVASLVISSIFCIWYLIQKHWIANDLLGLAFSVNGIELLQLNSVMNGCILLGGLFVYDVFWVFGTDVMVTVAKSFEAPIKLVFPQDILQHGLKASNFAILGLGDIVIPGIFIALLLRFDTSLKRRIPVYFISGFLAYLIGLIMTIAVMYTYNHAQPALLYLVPSCLGLPLALALFNGDIAPMFQYKDIEEERSKDSSEEKDEAEEQNAENSISTKKIK